MSRNRVTAIACLAVLSVCASTAWADAEHNNPNPQFVNISPLPGGGIAINSDGRPDGLGALQINIPVAYTPTGGYFTAGAFVGKGEPSDKDLNNPTGIVGAGFCDRPTAYVSIMGYTHHIKDEGIALNVQANIAQQNDDTISWAVGIQDIFKGADQVGYSGYIVMTKAFPTPYNNIYATVGAGGGRFTHVAFGGLSYPVTEGLNVAVEWDGYQVNSALAFRPSGRDGRITILGGYNGQAGVLVGVSGVIVTSSCWD